MELTQTSTVPVPVETAWKALDDPERIAPCMPGASLESVDGDSFTGNVKIEPRPIGLSHRGTARFVDADPETRTVIIEGSGKDAKGNGSASATVTARLTEDAGNLATLLTSDEDAPAAAPSTPTQAVAATAAPVAARPAVTARPPPSSTRSPCWASRRRSAVGWPPPWFSLTSSSWAGPSAGSATAADPHRGAPVPSTVTTVNPATGTTLATYPGSDVDGVLSLLGAVEQAQPRWAATPLEQRAETIRAVGARLREQADELAALMTAEMGKPVGEARAEVEKSATACDFYADHGPAALAPRDVDTGDQRSWVAHEPLGVVLAVMPWNFPFWQVLRFAAPTLLAGNTAILKHSPNVTGCALAVEQVFRDAGLPENAFRSIVVAEEDVPAVSQALIEDDRIAAVSLTGSERAGSAVAATAGRVIKKSLLELGGSDPFVVLDDADLDAAVAGAVTSRFINSGQSCLAAKRFVVHRAVAEEFSRRFAAAVADLRVGDPTDPATTIGPMARADLLDGLERQVRESVAAGASVLVGGQRLDRGGAWFAPTVVTDVTPDMPVMAEETFGPVAAVVTVSDDDEAVRVANATRYGLAASVWSSAPERALAVGRRITSGALFVNAVVASDPRLPFGGTKRSGYGRELGEAGALEFTNTRTYVIGTGVVPAGPATE
jgi:succinate-semialdehyde dehydrogenase/glutarate-semialdehyde dehydrogenase